METVLFKTRARLTGLFVASVLAVVLILFFFDGEGLRTTQEVPGVPLDFEEGLAPVVEPVNRRDTVWDYGRRVDSIKQEVAAIETVPDYLVEPSSEDEAAGTTVDELSGTRFNPNAIPEAWGLQLGSFTAYDNAASLKKRVDTRLADDGHRAYLATTRVGDLLMYRVAVGPFLSRSQAVHVQSILQQESLVVEPLLRPFSMLARSEDDP